MLTLATRGSMALASAFVAHVLLIAVSEVSKAGQLSSLCRDDSTCHPSSLLQSCQSPFSIISDATIAANTDVRGAGMGRVVGREQHVQLQVLPSLTPRPIGSAHRLLAPGVQQEAGYGKRRLFASLGWGLCAPLSGWIVGKVRKLFAVLFLLLSQPLPDRQLVSTASHPMLVSGAFPLALLCTLVLLSLLWCP